MRPNTAFVSFWILAACAVNLAPISQASARDVTAIVDVSGDGQPDVATFTDDDRSKAKVTLYSGANGRVLRTTTFLDSRYRRRALERIIEMPATGRPALAVLGTRADNGRHRIEVRDAASGDFVADYPVLNSHWDMVDLTVIDDLNGDGVLDDPALATLARLPRTGKILVQSTHLSDGTVIANQRYLNRLWRPLAVASARRERMPSLLAISAVLPTSNKLLIESRSVKDGALDRRSRPLNRLWNGQDLAAVQDVNGDGNEDDPAWVVLARNPNSGANVVQALQVSDGGMVNQAFVLNRLWEATRLATRRNPDGNGREQLLVSAFRPTNGNNVVNLSDFDSGRSLRSIYPPVSDGSAVITDQNADCIARAALSIVGPQEPPPPCSILEASAVGGSNKLVSRPAKVQSAGTEVIQCIDGGTRTVETRFANDAEPMQNAGDYTYSTMLDCDDGVGTITNGALNIDVVSWKGSAAANQWRSESLFTHDLRITWTDLSWTNSLITITDNRRDTAIVERDGPRLRSEVTGRIHNTEISDGRRYELRDYTIVHTEDQSTSQPNAATWQGAGVSNELQSMDSVSFRTLEPFVLGPDNDYASAGKLRITDASGRAIDCTVLDSMNVMLELDLDGDGEVDETRNHTWDYLFYGNVPRE